MSRLTTASMSCLVVLMTFSFWLQNIDMVCAAVDSTSASSQRVVIRGEGVDDKFFAKVNEGIQLIPDKIWRRIADHQVRVTAVRSLDHVLLNPDETPTFLLRYRGTYWDRKKAIYIAQEYMPKGSPTLKQVEMDGVVATVFHEVGHAYDASSPTTNRHSSAGGLYNAYRKDFRLVTPAESLPESLDHYVRDPKSHQFKYRPNELYAEAFSIVLRQHLPISPPHDGSLTAIRDNAFRDYFPTVLHWMKEELADITQATTRANRTEKNDLNNAASEMEDEVSSLSDSAQTRESDKTATHQHAEPYFPAVRSINWSPTQFDCCAHDKCEHSHTWWPAPKLVLRLTPDPMDAEHGWQLSSRDVPAKWTTTRPRPFFAILDAGEAWLDSVELFLDGEPWNEPPYSTEGITVFSLPCLSLGRHVLQARYLSGNRWSRLSAPLRFEVRPPPRPIIVALADAGCPPMPVSTSGIIPVRSDNITLTFGNVNPDDRVLAFLDGKPVICKSVGKGCCFQVPIRGFVEPGFHTLSVRSVPKDTECDITSQPSATVTIHYFENAAYVVVDGELLPTLSADVDTQCQCPKPSAEQNGTAPQTTVSQLPVTNEGKVTEHELERLRIERDTIQAHAEHARAIAALEAARGQLARAQSLSPRTKVAPVAAVARPETGSPNVGEDDQNGASAAPAARETDTEAQEGEAQPPKQAPGGEDQSEDRSEAHQTFTFLSSAHFPLREFGQRGEVFDREGAVIYEGMTVTIDEHGRLHLSGLVSTPAVPTTLHLRFVLGVKVNHASRRQLVTITFPPIQIVPSSEGGREIGETRELHELTKDLVLPRHSLLKKGQFTIENMVREGTARFGYGFAMTRQQNSP